MAINYFYENRFLFSLDTRINITIFVCSNYTIVVTRKFCLCCGQSVDAFPFCECTDDFV